MSDLADMGYGGYKMDGRADSKNRSSLSGINAVGIGSQDLSDKRGGNNSRSPIDTVRATGVVATGSPSTESRELLDRFSSDRKMTKQRNTAGRSM